MQKLSSRLILLTVLVSCLSCGKEEINPHVLDTQLAEMREYKVIDPKKMLIEFKESHPIELGKDSYGNGFYCFPPEDVAEMKRQALKCLDKK